MQPSHPFVQRCAQVLYSGATDTQLAKLRQDFCSYFGTADLLDIVLELVDLAYDLDTAHGQKESAETVLSIVELAIPALHKLAHETQASRSTTESATARYALQSVLGLTPALEPSTTQDHGKGMPIDLDIRFRLSAWAPK